MLHLTSRVLLLATTSVALLFTAAAPVPDPATPIANGAGVLTSPVTGNRRAFSFNVVELPDGSVVGHGQITTEGVVVHFQVTSYMFDSRGNLLAAGPITHAPNPSVIGSIAAFGVQDNGAPSSDKMTLVDVFPPAFFPDIQTIVAVFGEPPSVFFNALDAGNIVIH